MPRLYVSTVIAAPVDRVWSAIRDFNALPQWHPLAASSRIEDDLPSDTVGCVRNFQLAGDGQTIREQLLALSDTDRFCTYSILEAPLAVRNYIATLRLRPITQLDQTFAEWSSAFDVAPDDERAMCDAIEGIYRDGLSRLNDLLGSPA